MLTSVEIPYLDQKATNSREALVNANGARTGRNRVITNRLAEELATHLDQVSACPGSYVSDFILEASDSNHYPVCMLVTVVAIDVLPKLSIRNKQRS